MSSNSARLFFFLVLSGQMVQKQRFQLAGLLPTPIAAKGDRTGVLVGHRNDAAWILGRAPARRIHHRADPGAALHIGQNRLHFIDRQGNFRLLPRPFKFLQKCIIGRAFGKQQPLSKKIFDRQQAAPCQRVAGREKDFGTQALQLPACHRFFPTNAYGISQPGLSLEHQLLAVKNPMLLQNQLHIRIFLRKGQHGTGCKQLDQAYVHHHPDPAGIPPVFRAAQLCLQSVIFLQHRPDMPIGFLSFRRRNEPPLRPLKQRGSQFLLQFFHDPAQILLADYSRSAARAIFLSS